MRYVAVVLLSIAPAYLVWVACGSRPAVGAVIALLMYCFPPGMALWYAAGRDPMAGIVAATAAVQAFVVSLFAACFVYVWTFEPPDRMGLLAGLSVASPLLAAVMIAVEIVRNLPPHPAREFPPPPDE